MLCQNCGKYEATTHIKRIVNGEATEAHLCSDCARALGYDSVFPDFGFNFSDMLGSFFNEATVGALSNGIVRCEKCGSTFNDIVRSGRMGCGDCYSTFYDKLLPSFERIHGRTHHEGKKANTSPEIKKLSKTEELKENLKQAVEAQNYEEAARLRDEIKMSKWYIGAGEQNDIVISTRIRLARNIEDYPFPCKLDTKTRTALNKKIGDAVCGRENLEFIEMKTLTQPQIVSLAEKHLISPEFASSYDGRALLLSDSEGISIMLCEEDHIKIQVMKPGLSLETAYAEADRIDDELNEKFVFAFDDRLGYLTQCPTNLGTGMRASVLLHLPALTACGQMSSISSTVSKLGLTVREAFPWAIYTASVIR